MIKKTDNIQFSFVRGDAVITPLFLKTDYNRTEVLF